MALTSALFTGVSGVNSNGNAMNVIGDNIANVNTVGFKSSRSVFFDLLSADVGGSKVGLGSRFAAATRLFTQGGVETTNSPTDLAIQGRGFFAVQNAQGTNFYTRAGQFNLDKDGFLVNAEGLKVQGIKLDSSGNPITAPTNIEIDNGQLVAPTATTAIDMALNLDGAAVVPALALPADAAGTSAPPNTWFGGSNFSTVVTIYDSLGAPHDVTFLFRKTTTANEWDYRVLANGGDIAGGTAGQLQQISGAGGRVAYNPDGTLDLTAPTNTNISAIGPLNWADGAAAQTINAAGIRFAGSTQYSLPSSVAVLNQDGIPPATVTSIDIDNNGVISGLFSSGRSVPLFRLALADFANPQGLTHVGSTLFSESTDSGQALFGSPGSGGFGTVLSGTLELSTVDLATEFVKMITTQRGFQASSRTITVTDSMLEEIANLKR
jgi:flagellar hook protein FlgE